MLNTYGKFLRLFKHTVTSIGGGKKTKREKDDIENEPHSKKMKKIDEKEDERDKREKDDIEDESHSKKMIDEKEDERDKCAICLAPLENDIFDMGNTHGPHRKCCHVSCVQGWAVAARKIRPYVSCPVCRYDIFSKPIISDNDDIRHKPLATTEHMFREINVYENDVQRGDYDYNLNNVHVNLVRYNQDSVTLDCREDDSDNVEFVIGKNFIEEMLNDFEETLNDFSGSSIIDKSLTIIIMDILILLYTYLSDEIKHLIINKENKDSVERSLQKYKQFFSFLINRKNYRFVDRFQFRLYESVAVNGYVNDENGNEIKVCDIVRKVLYSYIDRRLPSEYFDDYCDIFDF